MLNGRGAIQRQYKRSLAPDGRMASGAVIVPLPPMVVMMVVVTMSTTGIKKEGVKKGADKAPTKKP